MPLLEIWREKEGCDGSPRTILESYHPGESIDIFKEALSGNVVDYGGENLPLPFNLEILKWAKDTHKVLAQAKLPPGVKFYNIYGINLETPHRVGYGSEETPITDLQDLRFFQYALFLFMDLATDAEFLLHISLNEYVLMAMEQFRQNRLRLANSPITICHDGLDAEARVGVPGEHRGILCEPHVFQILKHWLKAGNPDPFYNPVNDYVILPTAFEMESLREKGLQVTSLKVEREIVYEDQDNLDNTASKDSLVNSISVSKGEKKRTVRSEVHATVGKQQIKLNAISVSVDA
ncbi:cytochrome c6 [Hibiscus syriacus]|uniref:Cytochrome c6 n=1 Tax=Hibiscus syriacus TaxID=106335 RepID=A0A6A2Y1P3_HIBSY|nr:cytochrome c6 [Hibiscus syriacus]